VSKRNKQKRPINPLWVLSALIAASVFVMIVILSQRLSPPPDKPVLIRSALVEACRALGQTFYPDLSPGLLSNACYQEAIDLYAAYPNEANACYDVIPIDAAVAWGECMLDQGAEFSGVYLNAAVNQ
jgi:hypothetical protein